MLIDKLKFDAQRILSLSDTNDIYMEAKVLFLTDQTNLNGTRFTGSFINSVVEQDYKYQGLPLVVDMEKLESKKYNQLTHKLTPEGFGTQMIGDFIQFYQENVDNGALGLFGIVRIYKRFPATCAAILDLYSRGLLRFSVEVLVGEYYINDDGTKDVPASDENTLMGVAIVSNPAEPRSQAYYLVAEALLEDQKEVKTMAEINIDNSAEKASDVQWGDVDLTDLRDKLMEADNKAELVREAYLVVEEGWETAPSQHLKYPHHVIENDTLVVAVNGCQAAYQRLMQNDPNNDEALSHLKRHYDELGLTMEKADTEADVEASDNKEIEVQAQDNKEIESQIQDVAQELQALQEELAKCKAELQDKINELAEAKNLISQKEADIVSLGEAISNKDAEIASLNEIKVKYDQIVAEQEESAKQAKKSALTEKLAKFFKADELTQPEIAQAIESLDENAVNKLIADKVVAQAQNDNYKRFVTRITADIKPGDSADVVSKYITIYNK